MTVSTWKLFEGKRVFHKEPLAPLNGRKRVWVAEAAVMLGLSTSQARRTFDGWVKMSARRWWAYRDDVEEFVRNRPRGRWEPKRGKKRRAA